MRLLELERVSTVLDMMMDMMRVAMMAMIATSGKLIMTIVHLQLRLEKRATKAEQTNAAMMATAWEMTA